ncbi:hypothetical protein Lfu02_17130 [Longispora fulva]|uniref:hypothetical protein n=1 Tax=Longispora fulva TaxID=619741 RepID=UPI0018CA4A80|nr:hypothetical protein [Longispora fulva]GIG57341.1 hypothetical protein Lfu02_17130 [Longispora fulva]
MGAIVTLDLPDDSPAYDLPWIITFGPASDDEDEVWEPVVCGPYSREHALAVANAVVTDEELLAVVEPLQPHTEIDGIKAEIAKARELAASYDDEDFAEDDHEGHDHEGHDHDHDHDDDHHVLPEPSALPTAAELKAGFTAIAARLSA